MLQLLWQKGLFMILLMSKWHVSMPKRPTRNYSIIILEIATFKTSWRWYETSFMAKKIPNNKRCTGGITICTWYKSHGDRKHCCQSKNVNGTTGIIEKVVYDTDADRHWFSVCCYIYVEGCGSKAPGLEKDIAHILPVISYF